VCEPDAVDQLEIRPRVSLSGLLAFAACLSSCQHREARDWLPQGVNVALAHIDNQTCLNLRQLPRPWRISPNSDAYNASFGLPGDLGDRQAAHYRLMVDAGESEAGHSSSYASYARNVVRISTEKHDGSRWGRHPEWDVPGFEAFPADDAEVVWVGDAATDAVMECRTDKSRALGPPSCVLYDGKKPGRSYLNISFAFGGRARAAVIRQEVLRLIAALKVSC
jgi:hypothetical protein